MPRRRILTILFGGALLAAPMLAGSAPSVRSIGAGTASTMRTIGASAALGDTGTDRPHWRTISAEMSPKPITVTATLRQIRQERPADSVRCPDGTRDLGGAQARIRSVGQGSDAVIGGDVTINCLAVSQDEGAPLQPWIERKLTARAVASVSRRPLPEADPQTKVCVERAAETMGVKATPLYLILDVEGGTLGATSPNTNGTYDIGPAQINSSWLPKFAKRGVTEDALTNDLCTNIMAAAWIYAQAVEEGRSMAQAIALYHSPTRRFQLRYLGRIGEAIDRRLLVLGKLTRPGS